MKKIFTRALIAGAVLALGAQGLQAEGFDHLLIIGDATPGVWSINDGLMMVQDAQNPNVFRYTGWLKGNQNFKFTADNNFNNSELELRNANDDAYDCTKLVPANKAGNDNQFKVADDGNYDVTVNVSDLTIGVSKADYQDKPIRYNVIYAVGSATPGNWDLGSKATPLYNTKANPFELSTDVPLKSDGDKDGEFKLCANPYANWGGVWFHPYYEKDSDNQVIDSTIDYNKLTDDNSNDVKWKVTPAEAGNYVLRLNPEAMTFAKTKLTATGVENVNIEAADGAAIYYTLTGVRMHEPRKGTVCIEVRADGTAHKIIF